MKGVACRIMVGGLAFLLTTAVASTSRADPPLGDTCESPIVLEIDLDSSYSGDLGSYANDYDAGLPGPSCTGGATPGKDVVLAIEVPCARYLSVSMTPNGFDGALYIVTDCGDIANSCISGSDEDGEGAVETAWVTGFLPQVYYIIVDAHDADEGAEFNLLFEYGFWDIPPGACCFPDGHCEIMDCDTCWDTPGCTTFGPCSYCDPNPCDPLPVSEGNWGAVKAQYR